MKKIFFGLFIGGAGMFMAACDSQRSSTATETTTTAEKVTADQIPPPDTTSPETTDDRAASAIPEPMNQADAGEISAEAAARGVFVSEADFAARAVESGMAQVKFGHLADRKAVDPEVKRFGVQMTQDHTNANSLLMRLAQRRKWPTSSEMAVEHHQAYSKLATVMSDEFDQGYMAQIVQDHETAVSMYQQAATSVTDPELKTFVNNTLPALRRHLGMARELQKKVEANR